MLDSSIADAEIHDCHEMQQVFTLHAVTCAVQTLAEVLCVMAPCARLYGFIGRQVGSGPQAAMDSHVGNPPLSNQCV
jgi:hypothetical protein